jgi:Flp pilus assembly secretin CpaC
VEKLIVYVDGFNLYYGLRDLARRKLLWLDLVELSRSLRPRSELVKVKYFTAPVLDDPPAASRQAVYQAALLVQNPGKITITQGRYQRKTVTCNRCGNTWRDYEEKETDVNIATALVADAGMRRARAALIISADSDLVPAIKTAREVAPSMFMAAAFPPKRYSAELQALMPASFHINRAKIQQGQLPEVVKDNDGREYSRPARWR